MTKESAHKKLLSSVREKLESSGIQASSPRMAIGRYVLFTTDHPTADDVKEEVEKDFPALSMATVYNTLNLFVERGLLKEFQDPRENALRYDPCTKVHFHFVDDQSGTIVDIEPSQTQLETLQKFFGNEFQISEMEITFRGQRSLTPLPPNSKDQKKQ